MPPPTSSAPVGLPPALLALLGGGQKTSENGEPGTSNNSVQISGASSSSRSRSQVEKIASSILPPNMDSTANVPGVPKDFMDSLASMLEKSESKKAS